MKQQQILEAQLDNNQPKGHKLFTLEDIPNTPFKILSTEEGHTLVFQKFRLTDPLKNAHDVHEYLEKQYWNIITTIVLIMIEKMQGKNQPSI